MAALVFEGRAWLVPSLVALVGAAALVLWAYRHTSLPPGVRAACISLKIAGFALLLACFLEPTWTGQQPKPGANVVAVLADNSASMALRGEGETERRGETARRILTGEKSQWRQRLTANFTRRDYLFDGRAQLTQDFRELDFAAGESSLGHALRQVAEQNRDRPIAAAIVLTDGVAGDLKAELAGVEGLPPVFPVVLGKGAPPRDLGIAGTSVSQTSFEDAPVTVQAEISVSGFGGEEIVGTLEPIPTAAAAETKEAEKAKATEGAKKEVAAVAKPTPGMASLAVSETVRVPQEATKVSLRFQVRPVETGTLFWRLRVAPKNGELSKGEATLANNETVVTIERSRGPYRMLYVGGRPNWEYKYLHRAIEADDQMHMTALIRVAKREPKFEFRGRSGESSNPLFRGFGSQAKDEVEQYDQPVLVRLNTETEQDLPGGFPKRAEELFRYRALILDDVEAAFFSREQMSLVTRFVSERGGAVLMLGGPESFAIGGYQHTPIGDMLPVYLDRKGNGAVPLHEGGYHLALTREGWLQPWARLRPNETDERKRLAEMPTVDVVNSVSAVKPAAMVVATVSDGKSEAPALVTQRFGRGRTAAMMIGDLFQTGLGDEARGKDLAKAWRQTARWLVADISEAIEVSAEPAVDGRAMHLSVKARDTKFQPLENATVKLVVTRTPPAVTPGLTEGTEKLAPAPATEAKVTPIELQAEPSTKEAGLYETDSLPRESGGYRVVAMVTNEDGAPVGEVETGWSTNLAATEYRSLAPDRALMEALAARTGGKVLAPEDLEAFVTDLPARRVPVVETWSRPLWHTPVLFLLALACLAGEWALRRQRGLA